MRAELSQRRGTLSELPVLPDPMEDSMQTTRREGPTLDRMSLDQQSDVTDRHRGAEGPTERSRIVFIAVLVAALAVGGGLVIANIDRAPSAAQPTPSAAPPSTPASVDPRTAAGQAALAVYERYVELLVRSKSAPSKEPIAGLDEVAKDPARSSVFLDSRELAIAGHRQDGTFLGPPMVVEVQLLATPPSVRIEQCIDTSQTRITTAAGDVLRNTSTVTRGLGTTLLQQVDGSWYVISDTGKKAAGGGRIAC